MGLRARPSGTQEGSLVVNPTLRYACAGLLRVSASGTFQEHDTANGVDGHHQEEDSLVVNPTLRFKRGLLPSVASLRLCGVIESQCLRHISGT